MGVGLTLVRLLVQLHDGMVSAHSEGIGQGSQFSVMLPLTDKTLLEPLPHSKVSEYGNISPSSKTKLSIVLVEDNDDARMMLQSLLEIEGFDVTAAADGVAGLETILRLEPDIALIDIGLPQMDGYTVASRVREKVSSDVIYLIALTGYGQAADVEKSEAMGFDSHMTKPVDPQELTALLRSFGRNRSHPQGGVTSRPDRRSGTGRRR